MFSGIQDFTVEVPRPQFYLEPGYRSHMEQAGIPEFPLLGTMPETEVKVLKRLQIKSQIACCPASLLIRPEYEEIEAFLEEAVSDKWSGASDGRHPMAGKHLDYKISGQEGIGV